MELPKGSIKRLIGYELSWEDNPVELQEEYFSCDCGKSRKNVHCKSCGSVPMTREYPVKEE